MDAANMTEQRHHARPVVNGEGTIYAGAVCVGGPLVDLSEGGVQVLCRYPGAVGDAVEVRLAPEGYPQEVRVRGRVARVGEDRVGIEFAGTAQWRPLWEEITAFYAAGNRREDRYPGQGTATLLAVSQRARCEVLDVSRSGIRVRCGLELALASPVEVRFTPPDSSEEKTVAGRVARLRKGEIGIAFPETSPWQASWRKLVAFRTVSQKKQEEPVTPERLFAQIAAIQQEAAASPDIALKTAALWKMESLGVTFGRIAQAGESLAESGLPAEACPIVHVGMGGGAVETANFMPARITALIDSLAHPAYRLFGYEQIGAMLGVYEKSVPRLMLGLKKLDCPDPAQFFPQFPAAVRRLISHGYGRLLYFNSKDIHAALRNIRRRTFLDPLPAVQGMAFGYAMVNHRDLGVVLETGDSLLEPALVKAFQAGLVYALEFWEWMSPGFLEALEFSSPRATALVGTAREEVAAARRQGWLDPFLVRSLAGSQ